VTTALVDPTVYTDLSEAMGEDFAIELVKTFLDEAPQMVATLTDAAAQGAGDDFRRAAHSLKSNAEVFGASRLADMARALELGDVPEDAVSIQSIQETVLQTCAALRTLAHE